MGYVGSEFFDKTDQSTEEKFSESTKITHKGGI
jgi:hypothetical protein